MKQKRKSEKATVSLVVEYKTIRSFYERYTKKIETLIKTLIEESELQVHSVTSRTKTINSFSEKISQEGKLYNNISEITDLAGVRIICYFSSQVDQVAELIRQNFTVIPELSVNKRKATAPDRFGYASLHYVVKLTDERATLPEYKKYKDLLCEIQIRTILQHVWAEIEHDLGYKSTIEIPRDIRRRFSRLAGLLEMADDEFNDIKNKIKEHSEKVDEQIMVAPSDVLIDKISLKSYILKSPIITELDDEIKRLLGAFLTENVAININFKIVNYFKIKTINELDNIIKKNRKKLIEFAKQWIEYETKGMPISRGIAIFYLGYLLIGMTKNSEKIYNYLVSVNLVPRGVEDYEVLEMIDKISSITHKIMTRT